MPEPTSKGPSLTLGVSRCPHVGAVASGSDRQLLPNSGFDRPALPAERIRPAGLRAPGDLEPVLVGARPQRRLVCRTIEPATPHLVVPHLRLAHADRHVLLDSVE